MSTESAEKWISRIGTWLRRGYSLIFALVFTLYVGASALPAFLMAHHQETAAKVLYRVFGLLCHQLPYRSFFLYGEQAFYPLNAAPASGLLSFAEAARELPSGIAALRAFYGNPAMGYKMAICQRDTAIYLAMAAFCLLFFLSGNKLPAMPLKRWLIFGILPMAWDGGSQMLTHLLPRLLPFRESTPGLRVLTGTLFGFCTCWFLLPMLEIDLIKGMKE